MALKNRQRPEPPATENSIKLHFNLQDTHGTMARNLINKEIH
ncbi:10111_t:CDS:2 [Rhizophagus irregularis]|nr:10111_t:CDS:2 [Rhizophagus irregularis]